MGFSLGVYICTLTVIHCAISEYALPALDRRGDFLSLYDAKTDTILGLKLASEVGQFTINEEAKGDINIQDYILRKQSDYTRTHSLSAQGELNVLIRLLSGNSAADYAVTKFGTISKNTMIGLLVYERRTAVETVDVCSSSVYENLHFFSTFPANISVTHVITGKIYKIRVELAFMFEDSTESSKNISQGHLQGEIEGILGWVKARGSARGNFSDDLVRKFSETKIIVDANTNIDVNYPTSLKDVDAFVREMSSYLRTTKDKGGISEFLIEELRVVAVCQGLETPTSTYPTHSLASLELVRGIMSRLEQIILENQFYFNYCVHNFRNCYSETQLSFVDQGKINFVSDIDKIKFQISEAIKSYRNGTMSEDIFVDRKKNSAFREVISLLDTLGGISHGRTPAIQMKCDFLKAMWTHQISCWPMERENTILAADYAGKYVDFLLFNGSALLSPHEYNILDDFVANCSITHCVNCKCHVLDCQGESIHCVSYKNVTILPFRSKIYSTNVEYKVNNIPMAVFYNYEQTKKLEFIVDNILKNQVFLLEILKNETFAGNHMSGFIDLKNVSQFFSFNSNTTSSILNPVEALFGQKIRIIGAMNATI